MLLFLPSHDDSGPDVATLSDKRITFRIFSSDANDVVLDSWGEVGSGAEDQRTWIGLTAFFQGGCSPGGQGTLLTSENSSVNHHWSGVELPIPLKLEDPGVFTRRKDGTWRCRDTMGR